MCYQQMEIIRLPYVGDHYHLIELAKGYKNEYTKYRFDPSKNG
jgi:hypothetical protein